jgi:hypothetical protein
MNQSLAASMLQLFGAGGFGIVIGWYLYFVNRYRKTEVNLNDLVTLIGALGGGAVLTLFPARTDLFGAYGIGLFVGFFGYFLTLIVLVKTSDNFDFDWFLDGRRKRPQEPSYIPAEIETPPRPPMEPPADRSPINT